MYALGIVKTEVGFKWALAFLHEKKLIIEQTGEGNSLPEELLSKKDLQIVTGLNGQEVLRRDLELPLTSEKQIRLSLPFQIEPLLPFPQEMATVFPQYYRKEKETAVVVWLSAKESVETHLMQWQSIGIDPDFVSCLTLALARWAHFSFPQKQKLLVQFENLAIALDDGKVVCAMTSDDPGKLSLFLKQKYPLFESEEPSPFALAIGLALEPFEKHPMQLRTDSSANEKKRKSFFLKKFCSAGTLLLLFSVCLSSITFYVREKRIEKQIAVYAPEKTIEALRKAVLLEKKTAPPLPNVPSVQETLSWLSSLKTSVDLYHVSYELSERPYKAVLTLEFQAENASAADLFIKQLQQNPSFVESTHRLKWTSQFQNYKLSFPLKNF